MLITGKMPFPPTIDLVQTGQRIKELREKAGYTVKDIQEYLLFESPQAIYKWQQGKNLPSQENLVALGYLLDVSIEDILVVRMAS